MLLKLIESPFKEKVINGTRNWHKLSLKLLTFNKTTKRNAETIMKILKLFRVKMVFLPYGVI